MQRSIVRPGRLFYIILAITLAGAVLAAFVDPVGPNGRTVLGTLGVFVLVAGGWALSLIFHEFGHAIVAYRGGDHEVATKGYLSLDIRRYTDPTLSLVLPLFILVIGGIPLPGGAVWINRWALRSRAVSSWMSLAGPLTNLGIGIILTIITTLLASAEMAGGLLVGLSYLAALQILAFVINILPVPGLDGYGALEPYLSPQAREFGHKARPWAPLVLLLIIFVLPGARQLLWWITSTIFSVIGGNIYAFILGQEVFMFWRY